MKKFITLLASIGLAGSVFATGAFQADSPQSGVSAFTGTTQTNTVTFSPAFSTTPVVQVFGSATNASPITTTVTSSNLVIVVSSTNLSVAWNAYIGYPRVEVGSVITVAATATNVTFPTPYAFPPIVNVEGASTNANGIVAVTAITTTNFTMISNVAQTNQWGSIGTAYQPGKQIVTY